MKEQIHHADTGGIWFIVFSVVAIAVISVFFYVKKFKK
jgi:hypothetical protein